MSARTRVYVIVASVCVAAGGAAAGIVLAAGGGGDGHAALPKGNPPLELDLGLRSDPEARSLRTAQELYGAGKVKRAGALFGRYETPAAQIGAAMTAWPDGTTQRLEAIAASYPRSGAARLNLGFALYWAGKKAEALAAWRAAAKVDPDTPSAVRADDLLHPQYNHGLPTFVPGFRPPTLPRASAARQLAVLARRARTGDVRAKLVYGIALQRVGRPRSAERVYAQAARLAPTGADAQVAAAVGRFDKDHPERAFSRLGPLIRRFPHAPTVRFHLGLLLLWLGEVEQGKRELRLARAEGPGSLLGREAASFLKRLGTDRPNGPER